MANENCFFCYKKDFSDSRHSKLCRSCVKKYLEDPTFPKFICSCKRECLLNYTLAIDKCDSCLRILKLKVCKKCNHGVKNLYSDICGACKIGSDKVNLIKKEEKERKHAAQKELKSLSENFRRVNLNPSARREERRRVVEKLSKVHKSLTAKNEKKIQLRLERETGGKHVKCLGGEVDILTPDKRLIEIKVWKNWKGALGQLSAYSYYFPDYKLVVHLFGDRIPHYKEVIKVFEFNGIEVQEEAEGSQIKLSSED